MGNYLKKVFTMLKADLIEWTRIKIAIIISMLQPVVMVVAFGLSSKHGGGAQFYYSMPGILAIAVMYSVTFSAGYQAISDRERHLVDDVVLSPVSYSSFIVSRLLGALVKCILPTGTALLIGIIFFGVRTPDVFAVVIAYILTAIICAGLGMMVGAFTNYLAFEGMVNFFLVPFMFFGGIFFPIENLGGFGRVVSFFPITPAVELFRCGLTGKIIVGSMLSNYIIILVYAIIFFLFGVFSFKAAITKR